MLKGERIRLSSFGASCRYAAAANRFMPGVMSLEARSAREEKRDCQDKVMGHGHALPSSYDADGAVLFGVPPLHVSGFVGAAALQRGNVIDDVTGTQGWARYSLSC